MPAHPDNFTTADGTVYRISSVETFKTTVRVDWHSFQMTDGLARGPYAMGTCTGAEWDAMKKEKAFVEKHEAQRGKIITSFIYPPIPVRTNDWVAYRDGTEESGRYGYGLTEADAIADLLLLEGE